MNDWIYIYHLISNKLTSRWFSFLCELIYIQYKVFAHKLWAKPRACVFDSLHPVLAVNLGLFELWVNTEYRYGLWWVVMNVLRVEMLKSVISFGQACNKCNHSCLSVCLAGCLYVYMSVNLKSTTPPEQMYWYWWNLTPRVYKL